MCACLSRCPAGSVLLKLGVQENHLGNCLKIGIPRSQQEGVPLNMSEAEPGTCVFNKHHCGSWSSLSADITAFSPLPSTCPGGRHLVVLNSDCPKEMVFVTNHTRDKEGTEEPHLQQGCPGQPPRTAVSAQSHWAETPAPPEDFSGPSWQVWCASG